MEPRHKSFVAALIEFIRGYQSVLECVFRLMKSVILKKKKSPDLINESILQLPLRPLLLLLFLSLCGFLLRVDGMPSLLMKTRRAAN